MKIMDRVHVWLVDHNQPAAPQDYFGDRWGDVVDEKIESFFMGCLIGLMVAWPMAIVVVVLA